MANTSSFHIDLRHKGGAVVFRLSPDAATPEIVVQRKALVDQFTRKLKPFLRLPSRINEPLSLRAVVEHRLERSYPMPGGGTDDRYLLSVSIENDGEEDVTDFRLDVGIPS